MPEIPASEYLNSLLVAYQNADKIYGQAVSDVVAAEIRRDEAKKVKDEAMTRLEEAREKYAANGNSNAGTAHDQGRAAPKQRTLAKRNSGSGSRKKLGQKPNSKRQVVNKAEIQGKNNANNSDSVPPSSPSKIRAAIASPVPPPRPRISAENILISPTAGTRKVPKIFSANGEPSKRRSSKIGPLTPLDSPIPILRIATGRTRDWYDKNFDCEACGLVKKFYQATFGTKTHEKTQKVTVRTIVLNDEWNDLVADTSQIQEFYVGKGNNDTADTKPTLRDRAAEALVDPLQQEPVALFFAPKNALGTSEIFYGGSWKVVDGKMLNPARSVKGQPRQCLARFTFEGVDQRIIEALNR